VFVHKIAGAKAEAGASLDEVKATAEKVIANVRTMGVALKACTVPAAGKPGFELTEDEMELGIGIHGEPGTERKPIQTADEIVDYLMERILKDMDPKAGDEVAVMINGAGATPPMELYILNRRVQQILADKGIKAFKTFVGDYMTSIDMAGASITLLKLDAELKDLLLAQADTIGFKMY
ncbi:MAG: dihydroxyacetone kinase subunit DhaK, partial [Firmicutes bacterium]|nr:dihydroxyacetone kinase subunit DhaK [Bacillota bacterium]